MWSLAFAAIRLSLTGYSPGSLALFRFSIASICFALPFNQSSKTPKLTIRQLMLLLVLGSVGVAGYGLLLNSGEKTVSSGLASFIVAQMPVVTSVLAIALLKEKPSLMTVCGIGVSCVGVGIIVVGQPIHIDLNMGVFLVALATLCGSLNSVLQKDLLRDLSPFHVTTFSTWAAAVTLLIFLPDLIDDVRHAPLTSTYAALFLGVVPSTIGQWLWSYGLSKTQVVRASTYLYAMPILSTAFGFILLSEVPTIPALIGGCVALFGSALVKKDISVTSLRTPLGPGVN